MRQNTTPSALRLFVMVLNNMRELLRNIFGVDESTCFNAFKFPNNYTHLDVIDKFLDSIRLSTSDDVWVEYLYTFNWYVRMVHIQTASRQANFCRPINRFDMVWRRLYSKSSILIQNSFEWPQSLNSNQSDSQTSKQVYFIYRIIGIRTSLLIGEQFLR